MPGALAYSACVTQYQYAPSGVPTGLRYADCMALLQLRAAELGIADVPLAEVMADVQVIERAFVAARVEVAEMERAADGHAER